MHGKTSAADFSIVWCHYRFGFICINRANTSEVNPFSSQSYTISIWMHRGGRGKANRIRQGNYENWKTPFYHGEHVREEHKFHSSYRTPAETTIRREQYLLRAHQSMQQEKSQTQDDNRTTKDIKGSGVAGAVSSEQRARWQCWKWQLGNNYIPGRVWAAVCCPAYEQENGNNNVNSINMAYEQRSIGNPFDSSGNNAINCSSIQQQRFAFAHSLVDCAGNWGN